MSDAPNQVKYVPFDPTTKMSAATVALPGGAEQRVVKGAFAVVSKLAQPSQEAADAGEALEAKGSRVLAWRRGHQMP